jgi:hypothetical protein
MFRGQVARILWIKYQNCQHTGQHQDWVGVGLHANLQLCAIVVHGRMRHDLVTKLHDKSTTSLIAFNKKNLSTALLKNGVDVGTMRHQGAPRPATAVTKFEF